MNQELLEVIKKEEGTKKKDGKHIPYKCSEGKLTIGYGLLIDPDVSGGGLTDVQAEMLLKTTVDTMLVELYNRIPWYKNQPEPIKIALANMAYQLGVPKLLQFTKTLDHIEHGRYGMAAAECLNSKWYQQTPNRAKRVSDVFQNYNEGE
jgi:lysozyme